MTEKSSGQVFWLTGLSGAGKSTIGRALADEIKKTRQDTLFIDGDIFRNIIGDQLGHSQADRLENAYRISRLAKYLCDEGLTVVCATMSLFPEIWKWNRENISSYFEVYLKVSLEELKNRDPKGIYAKAQRGEASGVVGIDIQFQEPNPHLIIDNDHSQNDFKHIVSKILDQQLTMDQR